MLVHHTVYYHWPPMGLQHVPMQQGHSSVHEQYSSRPTLPLQAHQALSECYLRLGAPHNCARLQASIVLSCITRPATHRTLSTMTRPGSRSLLAGQSGATNEALNSGKSTLSLLAVEARQHLHCSCRWQAKIEVQQRV